MKTFASINNLPLKSDPGFADFKAGDYSIDASVNSADFSQVGLARIKTGTR